MTRRFWLWWIGINALIATVLPYAFAQWLLAYLAEERRLDPGLPTDGDSPGIPIGGFTLMLWTVQLGATALAVAIHVGLVYWRRHRTSPAHPI